MKEKTVLVLVVCALLFCGMWSVRFVGLAVEGSDGFEVHNVDTGLNYTTIQAALDANETLGGHTILVDAGFYFEHVVVRKPVFLVGENVSTTVIDAGGTGNGVTVRSSNATVTGFTIRNSGSATFQYAGIYLENVKNCTVSDNVVMYGQYGIWLANSGGNVLQRNVLTHNSYNFRVSGLDVSSFVNFMDSSNTVNGKPVYYWVNVHDERVPTDAGYVAAVNCTGITVRDMSLSDNGQGMLFAFVNGSVIKNVTVVNNLYGIWVTSCDNCTIADNDASGNGWHGIHMERSTNCEVVGNEASRNGYLNKYDGYGIFVGYACRNVSICENRGHENYYAIVVLSAQDCVISSNNVSNNDGMGIWPKFCKRCICVGNEACNNTFYGLEPEDSVNCTITGNNASSNGEFGIWVLNCDMLSVTANYLQKNAVGVGLTGSNLNEIYHNNFVDNRHQVSTQNSSGNEWNTSVEGNYWSDYDGQDENHDGIGDTAFVIDESNADQYPLVGLFSDFGSSGGTYLSFVSNVTLTDLEYFASNSTIRVSVSSSSDTDTYGFCRICVPQSLISPPYTVVIDDGLREPLYFNDSLFDNGTHRWIYFAYSLPAHEVSVSVIPEFPSIAIIAMTLMATLTAVTVCKRRKIGYLRTDRSTHVVGTTPSPLERALCRF
jgi:parallel beta-helix repeat protein